MPTRHTPLHAAESVSPAEGVCEKIFAGYVFFCNFVEQMEPELAYTGPLVVFDLDDTLYKELDFLKSGFRAVSRHAATLTGIEAESLYSEMMAARQRGENAFDTLHSRHFDTDKDFISRAVEIYRFHKPQIALDGDVREVLEALSRQGLRLGLVTDGRSTTQRNKIEALGITRYFAPENILISEETGVEKSSILPWQTLVRRYPNAARFIYVGDNPAKDFHTPRMLGWTTIGVRDREGINIHPQSPAAPEYAPDVWIDELSELPERLEGMNTISFK